MKTPTIINSSPYELFRNEKERSEFIARCHDCARRDPDKYGMPQCPIFEVFYHSILDRTYRWRPEWITIERAIPTCTQYINEGGTNGK